MHAKSIKCLVIVKTRKLQFVSNYCDHSHLPVKFAECEDPDIKDKQSNFHSLIYDLYFSDIHYTFSSSKQKYSTVNLSSQIVASKFTR
jgi:hypothetical protein